MDPVTAKLMSAAGAAEAATYVDDVFSIDLWTGTGSAQSITNGIDISGEGGMIWTKSRTSGLDHYLSGPDIGTNSVVRPNSDTAKDTSYTSSFTAFNNNGFSLGTDGIVNNSSTDYVGWTFRKCPGFFDIVTYTGTGSVQNISHNLGSVPGSIWIKCTSQDENWSVFHRSSGATHGITLNSNGAAVDADGFFNDTAPTSSVFTVGTSTKVNGNGLTFVAYLFAHDDQSFGDDEDEAIIKCGSFTASDGSPHTVTVGFEPQWVIIKRTTNIGDWTILDNMRGWVADTSSDKTIRLLANLYNAEEGLADMSGLTSTGFTVDDGGITYGSNQDYIYIAIRRPHKPPSAGTDVFAIDTKSAKSANTPSYTTNFPVDFALRRNDITSTGSPSVFARLAAGKRLLTNSTAAATTDATFNDHFMFNNGYGNFSSADSNDYGFFFKRAPGFFDVVTYDGSASAQNINHNLGVAPELIITKRRDTSSSLGWIVSSYHWFASTRWDRNGRLNQDNALTGGGIYEPASSHSATQYPVPNHTSDVNASGGTYLALLFASLDGISKVGTYAGTGSDIDVDCGFTNGARFVLIKKLDQTGAWFVFDSVRGIVSGNDPYFTLESSNAEGSSDWIDPLNAGFRVPSTAPITINQNQSTYLFLAIA